MAAVVGVVRIDDLSGKKQDKNDVIMPEDTITAKTNSVYYYTQRYSSLLTTILALVTTVIAIFGV